MTRTPVPDPIRSPSSLQCCGAAAGLVLGMVRPRRPDEQFIRSIVDAGLPAPGSSVTVTALPQAPRHTAGSVGVLAHPGRGLILIAGDAAWHVMQIEKVRQKSSYPGLLVDEDREETFRTLQRLHLARHAATIIPTHDHQAALQLPATAPRV